jgi:hypothetical protein
MSTKKKRKPLKRRKPPPSAWEHDPANGNPLYVLKDGVSRLLRTRRAHVTIGG